MLFREGLFFAKNCKQYCKPTLSFSVLLCKIIVPSVFQDLSDSLAGLSGYFQGGKNHRKKSGKNCPGQNGILFTFSHLILQIKNTEFKANK